MAIVSTPVITYQSRLIDSGTARAIFKVTTTTTVTTAPDSPVGTVVAETSAVFESVDYTVLYTSINNNLSAISTVLGTDSTTISSILAASSQSLENIEKHQEKIRSLSEGSGIHMKGPLDWVGLVSTYKLYVENVGPENVTLAGLIAYKAKIDALPTEF
jgi:hypothetical protein